MRFERPDRFVVGTIGPPGQRVFIIEARQGSEVASVVVEKVQVKLLAERVAAIVDGVSALGEVSVPRRPESPLDRGVLHLPTEPAFRVAEIRLGWDRPSAKVIIELDGADGAIKVHLSLGQAQDFIVRAEAEVASGRAACPFCGQPLDPSGHLCPRRNGFRPALFEQ